MCCFIMYNKRRHPFLVHTFPTKAQIYSKGPIHRSKLLYLVNAYMPGKKYVKIYSLVKKSYCKVEKSLKLNRGGLMGTNTRM